MKNPAGDLAIAVDFGGSKILAGLADRKGDILTKFQQPSNQDPGKAISTISHLIEQLLANKARSRRITGIGISAPGMVDSHNGTLLYAPFYDLRNFPLGGVVENRFGIKTYVENDVNSSALAELHFGHGKRIKNFFWITISNGVGGALVVNGQLHKGAHGLAGEIGHITVKNQGKICDCGKRGCLETIVSGRAIEKSAVNRLKKGHKSIITSMICTKNETLRAKTVCAAAKRGDPLAQEVLSEAIEYLAKAISITINLLDPQMVILGGGVSQAGAIFLGPLRRRVEDYTIMGSYRTVPITRTQLGYYASLIGAATLVLCEGKKDKP
ncbi:MAG TPA: ROK family protein [Candidatus Avalokitesvara rifleensis]|uniref:ROK family protein n=1 Tax=Candidatus Avalokitesvara rifleensis TaxID=3367620 RepID=UPI00271430D0|nr:ROK family protein [Candidatus Brocadiales bacterium]